MRRLWCWRHVGMLAGSGILLQTAGCNLDQATQDALVSAIVQIVLQVVLGSVGGTGFTT